MAGPVRSGRTVPAVTEGTAPLPASRGEEAKDYPRARRYGVMRHSAYRMAREARKFSTR